MKHLKKYKSDDSLSGEELEKATRDLLSAKFNEERRAAWKAQLAKDHAVQRTIVQEVKLPKRRRFLYVAMAAAAALLFLLVAFPFIRQSSDTSVQALAMEYLEEPYPNNMMKKGEQTSIPETRLKAIAAYNQTDYIDAKGFYKQIIQSDEVEVGDYLYLGLSELYTENYADAVAYLEEAKPLTITNHKFEQEVNWFLSLAYVQNQQVEDARLLLQTIVRDKTWMHQNASKLLEQL